MKVRELQEGMILLVSSTSELPAIRDKDPEQIFFYPDIFSWASFSDVRFLDKYSHYMYLGKVVRETVGNSGRSVKCHYELMSDSGIVYKIQGRWFKNFMPAWEHKS